MAEHLAVAVAPQRFSTIRAGHGVVPHTTGFWFVAAAFVSLQAFGTVPTPLWPLYAVRDGLSPTAVTLAFACMVVGAGTSLYLFGHLRPGRPATHHRSRTRVRHHGRRGHGVVADPARLGGDRGGWYSWDHLDNAGRPSAQTVHPEWQDIGVGDYVKYWTRRHGLVDAWQVAALEPNRFLGLRGLSNLRGRSLDPKQPRPSAYTEGLWGFLLTELPGGRTRLVIGGYQAFRPRWLGRFLDYWLYPPVVWIMQARMLAVLKRNVERAAPA
jgi:hypothetical protein